MSGHTPFRDLEHKATPEQLAAARAVLNDFLTSWEELRRLDATSLGLRGLYDAKRLGLELGISERAALTIMRHVPKQHVPGLRKVYVRAADVQAFLDEHVVSA